MKKRIIYLDLLKIIAMFLVSFYHIGYYYLDYGFIQNTHYIPNLNRIIMNICAMSVPIFFTVSGALMLNKTYTNKKIITKIINMIILIIFWSLLIDYPRWFLITLTGLYVIYPFIKQIFDKNKKLFYFLILLVFIMPFMYNFIIFIGTMFDIKYLITLKRTGLFTIYSLLYFMIGGVLFNITMNKKIKPLLIILFLIGLFLTSLEGYVFTNFNNTMFDNVNASFPTVGALLMSGSVFLLFKDLQIKSEKVYNLVVVIASNCLGVYLFHLFLWSLLLKVIKINSMSIFLCALICIFIDSVAIIVSVIISKIPYLKKVLQF